MLCDDSYLEAFSRKFRGKARNIQGGRTLKERTTQEVKLYIHITTAGTVIS